MALAIERVGTERSKIPEGLRAVAGPPGEIIRPGEWAKAKKADQRGQGGQTTRARPATSTSTRPATSAACSA